MLMSLFEEINTGEGDFNELSSPLTNENTAFEEVSPFNQISRSVWKDISNDSPFSNVKDTCGDFDKKFYGLSLGQGINWDRLVKFLKQRKLSDQLFNYDEFKGPVYVTFSASGNYSISKTESNTPIPFTYTTSHLDGEREQKGLLNGKLNKRVCYLSHDYGHIVRIDAEDEEIKATLQFYYENTAKYRVPVRDTPKPNDFYINDKYVAVALNTSNLRDFVHAILLIEGDHAFNKIKNKIITQYVKALKKAKDSAAINFLYENAPEFVLDALSDHLTFETFVQHIDLLIKHDTEGIFSGYIDSSSAMVNLFKGIGNIKQLYKLLRDNPTFVKTIYYNLDGDSEVEINVNGQAQKVTKKNRVIFSQLMLVLCKLNQYEGIEEQETSYHYYLGQNYRIDSNMNPENDADESNPEQAKKYWLQQWSGRTVMKDKVVDHDVDLPRASRKVQVPTIQFYPDDKGHYFYPFEPITLSLIDDKDDGTVPAIYIKALADSAERESIHEAIRIGADFLAIIIGVATLGSASPLLLALSIADIGLASSDLMVIASQDELMKTKEGQEFLANWNKFMAISGVAVASPLVINSASKALISGARLLGKVSVQSTRNFIMSVMIKAMLELNILRFSKNTVKIVPKIWEMEPLLSASLIQRFQKLDVIFVSGNRIVEGKTQQMYAVIYKNVVLVEGNAQELNKVLKGLSKKSSTEIIEFLNRMVTQSNKNRFVVRSIIEDSFGQLINIRQFEDEIRAYAVEYGRFADPEGNFISMEFSSNSPVGIDIPLMVYDRVKQYARKVFIHNHPTNTALSGFDVMTFLSMNLDELRAICKDGTNFVIRKKGMLPVDNDYRRFIKKIYDMGKEKHTELWIKSKNGDKVAGKILDQKLADMMIDELGDLVEYIKYE